MVSHIPTLSLPRFAQDLLAGCPTAGAGVHNWLYRTARALHPYYADKTGDRSATLPNAESRLEGP
jgi:hypothetical protein